MKRARLLRYSRYQLSDYFIERAFVVAVLAAVNLVGPVMTIRSAPAGQRILLPDTALGREAVSIVSTLVLLTVLFTGQELVSRPRKAGYYRLVFAKPVSPVLFQAQLFAVHLVATILLVTFLCAIFGVVAAPLPLVAIAGLTAITFLLLGGIGFLASAFVRFDSIIVMIALALSFLGKMVAAGYTGFAPKLANLLIPVDHLVALRPVIVGGSAPTADFVWVAAYGAVAFVLGLIAVRYRQLGD